MGDWEQIWGASWGRRALGQVDKERGSRVNPGPPNLPQAVVKGTEAWGELGRPPGPQSSWKSGLAWPWLTTCRSHTAGPLLGQACSPPPPALSPSSPAGLHLQPARRDRGALYCH